MAPSASSPAQPLGATGVLVLADGSVLWGRGAGAEGASVGEVCFNTAMTGYQEVMTDPSYASQIVAFTFPHIGNVGANDEDIESAANTPSAVGCILRESVSEPSSFRSGGHFSRWLADHGKIALTGIDTRALTRMIRMRGAQNAVIAHRADGVFDLETMREKARAWAGLEGMDLAAAASRQETQGWAKNVWKLGAESGDTAPPTDKSAPHVVAVDYGAKDNIFRNLVRAGARVSVVPATTSFDAIMALEPDGVFLSNGPGDPAATGAYAVPVIKALLEADVPIFGICLGHQMLALAAGASTVKMHQGHRGANHPVQRVGEGWGKTRDLVEITSMNHGFAVDAASLPDTLEQTHVSLFDGTNCGIAVKGKRAFGVQYHPEASPGPMDSFYLFEKFVGSLG